jgi:hypothetical protein
MARNPGDTVPAVRIVGWLSSALSNRVLSSRVLPPLLCLLASLLAVAPHAGPDTWTTSHEGLRYPALVEHFYRALAEGELWPRWIPELDGGYGYPQFVYYQPLFFLVCAPVRALTGSALLATQSGVALAYFLGALGAYWLVSEPLSGAPPGPASAKGRDPGGWALGALGALAFLLAPYQWLNWLVRGDLSELLAAALCPWALRYFFEAARGGRVAPLGLTVALTLLAHPIIGLLLGLLLALGVVLFAADAALRRAWQELLALRSVVLGGLVALGLAAPYWLPLALCREEARLELAFVYDPRQHTVSLAQLFAGGWGHGGSLPAPEEDKMPFPVGRAAFALGCAGLVLGWRRVELRVASALLACALLAMLPLSEPLWGLPLLRQMQFPWRLLALVVTLELCALRGLFLVPARAGRLALPARALAMGGAATLLAALGWHPGQFSPPGASVGAAAHLRELVDGSRFSGVPLDQVRELTPRGVEVRPPLPLGDAPDAFVLGPPGTEPPPLLFSPSPARHSLHFQVAPRGPSALVVNQFYFPGWVVEVDGARIDDKTLRAALEPDGLLRVALTPRPDGRPVSVGVSYGQPPGTLLGLGLAAGAAFAFALGPTSRWLARRRRRTMRA